ncbi:hypothetical protein ACP70R_043875 [Stipagrostis hirtigluma subsp. patula]
MVEHRPTMGNLSALVLDDNAVSLRVISKMLAKFNFKVLSFQSTGAALDFLKRGNHKEEELDLVLAEVHFSHMASNTLANSELFQHILNELQVPLITMCAYDDEEAVSECMIVGACFHVLKPLNNGSFNIMKQKALQHRYRKESSERPRTLSRTESKMVVSSSTENPSKMSIIEKNVLCNLDHDNEENKGPEVSKAHGYIKKSGRLTWTKELHENFLEAIEVIGEKYAVPERILKHMNVPNLTTKHIASHLQKHRQRKKEGKQGWKYQQNGSMRPVSELIKSAHNAATSKSVTPRADVDIKQVHPSYLLRQMKKRSAEAAPCKTYIYRSTIGLYGDDTKSVWDRYQKSLQKGSSKKFKGPAKNKSVMTYEGVSNETPNVVGGIGYNYGTPANVPVEETSSSNNLTKAAGNNNLGNINLLENIMTNKNIAAMGPSDGQTHLGCNSLLDDTNENSGAEMEPSGPSVGQEEDGSFWMNQLGGPQVPQNFGLEEMLQVEDAWDDALQCSNLMNRDDEPIAPEPIVRDAPAHDPMMQLARADAYWTWSPPVFGDYDMLL